MSAASKPIGGELRASTRHPRFAVIPATEKSASRCRHFSWTMSCERTSCEATLMGVEEHERSMSVAADGAAIKGSGRQWFCALSYRPCSEWPRWRAGQPHSGGADRQNVIARHSTAHSPLRDELTTLLTPRSRTLLASLDRGSAAILERDRISTISALTESTMLPQLQPERHS